MPIRFNKRVRIAPGVRLNFSKSGVSTTIGGRGGSVNIGKKGVHANAGLPGTGLSSRTKIMDFEQVSPPSSPSTGRSGSALPVLKWVVGGAVGVLLFYIFL